MARVRCVTRECQDALLLDAWLRHHGHLFGFENLTVLDGVASDPAIETLLLRAKRAGADIRREHQFGPRDVGALMTAWRTEAAFDFAIQLACDEFLAVYTSDGLSCRRDRIHAALDDGRSQRALVSAPCLASVDGSANEFAISPAPIGILPAEMIGREDLSGAPASWPSAATRRQAAVTCLRFGDHPVEADGIRVVFQGFGNLLDAFGIRDGRFGSPVSAPRGAPDDAVWVRKVGGAPAVRFKASAYGRANEDVGSSDWLAFLHYAALGRREGRRLR